MILFNHDCYFRVDGEALGGVTHDVLHASYLSFSQVICFSCCDSFPEHPLLSPFVMSLSQRCINGLYVDKIVWPIIEAKKTFLLNSFPPGADLLLVTINQSSPKRKELRISRQTKTTSANKSHRLTLNVYPWRASDSHRVKQS